MLKIVPLSSVKKILDAETRNVYFGGNLKYVQTPIMSRADLDSNDSHGPLIIEEYDSTTVVPPGWTVTLDGLQNIVMVKD